MLEHDLAAITDAVKDSDTAQHDTCPREACAREKAKAHMQLVDLEGQLSEQVEQTRKDSAK